MKTYIVAISVRFFNSRKICELIENQKFESLEILSKYLLEHLQPTDDDDDEYRIFEITDFMDECNNEDFSISDFFISYVTI